MSPIEPPPDDAHMRYDIVLISRARQALDSHGARVEVRVYDGAPAPQGQDRSDITGPTFSLVGAIVETVCGVGVAIGLYGLLNGGGGSPCEDFGCFAQAGEAIGNFFLFLLILVPLLIVVGAALGGVVGLSSPAPFVAAGGNA